MPHICRNTVLQCKNFLNSFRGPMATLRRMYSQENDGSFIGFIGGGLVESSKVYVAEPYVPMHRRWRDLGVNVTTENGVVVTKCKTIFLAVKTTALKDAVKGIAKTLPGPAESCLIVSALAGISLDTLRKIILPVLPEARIVRSTLNTPLLVGAGCTVFSVDERVTEQDVVQLKKLMSSIGMVDVVPETQMNAVGALVGCGPAYMFVMLEAIADGAVKMGVPRDLALRLATQIMHGSAKMVQDTGKHPGELKDEVCSPGGTTIGGLHALEKGGLRATLIDTIEAAVERSRAISAN
ncbi:pyrroline-5-carboxylate reductase isoform X2 [Orussus abietinus]|uniref:pyrroline-5-carboxylate reductase isoform X2 n=1 Tax=Orussus abietinus TaxID=222816 RepID=UPI000C715EBF|nr:pyrroline-5-carboxylate reductase isoform X2 [Orussus abietinus]